MNETHVIPTNGQPGVVSTGRVETQTIRRKPTTKVIRSNGHQNGSRLTIHRDGSVSVKVDGIWKRHRAQIAERDFLALPRKARARLIGMEYLHRAPLILHSTLVVTRNVREVLKSN